MRKGEGEDMQSPQNRLRNWGLMLFSYLLYHADGALDELGECLAREHAVLQESKVDELADALVVLCLEQLFY